MEYFLEILSRHEEQKHGEPLPEEDIAQDESEEDYKFNYHSAKLTFGLVLLEFNDAVKEGDGGRLFELYKLALLLYKTHGHYKYAYAVLLYLVKCIAILPPSQALRLKWNRTFNGSGLPGRNIPLDLVCKKTAVLPGFQTIHEKLPIFCLSLLTFVRSKFPQCGTRPRLSQQGFGAIVNCSFSGKREKVFLVFLQRKQRSVGICRFQLLVNNH